MQVRLRMDNCIWVRHLCILTALLMNEILGYALNQSLDGATGRHRTFLSGAPSAVTSHVQHIDLWALRNAYEDL